MSIATSRPLFTVFTSVRNRAHTIHRVYESLVRQTYQDFEWLIVDNESTDNLRELVQGWQKVAQFPIRYVLQENRGKTGGLNRGVQEAHGELFIGVDSDDELVPHALERFKYHWDSIPEDQRSRFSTVTSLCMDQYGKIYGNKFPSDVVDSNYLELIYKFKVKGEKCGCHRTAILRQYPFRTVRGELYVPENPVWSAMARSFKTRFVNDVLRVNWRQVRTTSDQLSHKSVSQYPGGIAFMNEWKLTHDVDWLRYAPTELIRSAVNFSRFSFHAGEGVISQARHLNSMVARLLWLLMLPVGFLLFRYERSRLRR